MAYPNRQKARDSCSSHRKAGDYARSRSKTPLTLDNQPASLQHRGMTKNTLDIQPRPIPLIESETDLTEAARVLAHRCGAYLLDASLRTEADGSMRISRSRQISYV